MHNKNVLLCAIVLSTTLVSAHVSTQLMANEVTDPITVTATRFPTSIPTTASDITIIDSDTIKRSSTHSVSQALETLGGVHINDLYGISGSKSSVDLGGFGSTGSLNTLILVNGRRLNDVDLSGANLAAIPLGSVEKIEIIRGTSTVLYGDNAVGGVINIVTKTGFDSSTSSISIMNGSYDTTKLNASVFEAKDDTAVAYFLEYFDSTGYRDNSGFKNINSFLDLSQQFANGVGGVRIQASNEDLRLPGEINETTFLTNPTASNGLAQTLDESQQSIEAYFNNDNFAVEWSYRDKDQAGKLYGDTFAYLATRSLTPRLKHQLTDQQFIIGMDLYGSTLSTLADFGSARNVSQAQRDSIAIYFTDTYKASKELDISLGFRRQLLSLDINNNDELNTVTTSQHNKKYQNANEITASYHTSPQFNYYAKYATGFRFPVLDEMWDYFYGTIGLLSPQTSKHTELGTQVKISDHTTLQASLFHITVEDEIIFDVSKYNNINLPDPTQHDGLNLQLNQTLENVWHIQAHYSYRKARFSGGPNQDKSIPLVPARKFTLSQQIDINEASSFTIDTLYTGTRYFGDDFGNNGKTLAAYTLIDIGYKQTFHDWRLGINIHNISDKRTADIGYYRDYFSVPYVYYPLPERSLYLELGIDL